VDWIKKYWERCLLICLTILVLVNFVRSSFLNKRLDDFLKGVKLIYQEAPPIDKEITLDFSNKTGAARIQSSFNDLLVMSNGSEKKGEGYVVYLKTINPSSIQLSGVNIVYSWEHNGQSQAATITNPNEHLFAGASVTSSAYLSPVEGNELKLIKVKVGYDLMFSK
jgi:hypothetical protein